MNFEIEADEELPSKPGCRRFRRGRLVIQEFRANPYSASIRIIEEILPLKVGTL